VPPLPIPPSLRANSVLSSTLQEVAKGHTDASLTDRASAGLDAVSDKLQEEKQYVQACPSSFPDPSLTYRALFKSSGQAEAYKKSAQH
jgi:hypothetical protein